MNAPESVMNNVDLRGVIWSFLKKDSRIRCITCKMLYYNDSILTYPIWDLWINQCKSCKWTCNTRDILGY